VREDVLSNIGKALADQGMAKGFDSRR
jgi:hypothetical protein